MYLVWGNVLLIARCSTQSVEVFDVHATAPPGSEGERADGLLCV